MHPDALASMLRLRSTTRAQKAVQGLVPELTATDVALALANAGTDAVAASRWRHLQDATGIPQLATHPAKFVEPLAPREELHAAVDRERLVEIVLIEETWPHNKKTVFRRARCADCSVSTWRRRWMRPHAALASRLDCLVDDAWRILRRQVA